MPDIEDCLRQLMAIHGAIGATLVDYPSGSSFGTAGTGPRGHAQVTATGAAHLVRAAVGTAASVAAGRPDRVEDIVVTAANGFHLVHVPPDGPKDRLALYVWLDRARGNLAISQRTLRTIGGQFAAVRAPR